MTWAPQETQKAVFTVLSNDNDLQTLLGGAGRVFDHVPDNTDYPYLTIYVAPWGPRDNYVSDGVEGQLRVSAWVRGAGRGDKDVQDIQSRVDELLNEANLSISGWDIIAFRRQLIEVRTEDDNVTKQGIQIFKIMLGEQ